MYSFVDDIILDPFCGSGTTLKVAKELNRHYVGYEIGKEYKKVIESKIKSLSLSIDMFEGNGEDLKPKKRTERLIEEIQRDFKFPIGE